MMRKHMRPALRRAYASRICVGQMPPAMHVRTNELTYAETTYVAREILKLVNACARVPREMSVVPRELVCPDHPGQLAGACNGCEADRKAAPA